MHLTNTYMQFIQFDRSAGDICILNENDKKNQQQLNNKRNEKSKSYCNNINFNYNNRDTNVYKYIIKAISFLKRQCTHRNRMRKNEKQNKNCAPRTQ